MRFVENIPYLGEQMLDLYLPDQPGFDTIVWYHGGGLEAGSRKSARELGPDAVKLGFGFVSVEYRMYPAAHFPDYLVDSAAAAAFVQKKIGDFGGTGRIIVSGQSAGAYITMMLAMNPAYLINAKADRSRIAAYVSDSAQQAVHFNVLRERGVDSRAERIDEAAPLFYTDSQRLSAPLLMICYSDDMPCRLQENQLMYRSLLRFDPDAPVEFLELPGKHCAGSAHRDENGAFPYLTALRDFLARRGIS